MTRILITGGTGEFGRHLVPLLLQGGHTVRLVSRHPRPTTADPAVEWAQAELGTDTGWATALHEAPIVVHAASDPQNSRTIDVDGTRLLLSAMHHAGVRHVLYISIVGVDRHPYPYYQDKLTVEGLIRASGVPYTILRATQFHSFIDRIFTILLGSKLPLGFLPNDFQSQPIATSEAAQFAAQALAEAPAGLLPDVAGPEVLRFDAMAKLWQAARRQRKPIIPVWLPLGWAQGFREGLNTNPKRAVGQLTWRAWLQTRYPAQEAV